MYATGQTHVGKTRSNNQDTIFVSPEPIGSLPNLCVVADGMGGHNGGEVASQQAVDFFCDYLRKNEQTLDNCLDIMMAAAQNANRGVYENALADPALRGMGTTLTSCVLLDTKCVIVHIGDSRAYKVTPERIEQLTTDHSYVNEMVKAGQLTRTEAREHPKRNVLTRVLGIDLDMAADGYIHEIEPNSVILLCSDGLTNMLTDDDIFTIVNGSAENKTQKLIDAANQRGGLDNISVILLGAAG